jgi:RIO kinase 2
MYMSRLAALKEYEFMKALRREGFPVPEPVGQNRHTVIMGLVDAFPMRQISKVGDPATLYAELLAQIVRLAQHGLIHGDFNEFNILVEERQESDEQVSLIPTIIDFPQMVSIDHANAEYYFDRDVGCIKRFFDRRFGFTSDEPGPFLKDATKTIVKRLDVEVQASGFSKKMAKELEVYMKEHGIDGDAAGAPVTGDDKEEDEVDDEIPADAETQHLPEEEDFGTADNSSGPVKPFASVNTSDLTSHMTILDIRDNDPLPDFSEVKTPPQPSISTKAAKKKAGWAL